jgi:hypothetical protein
MARKKKAGAGKTDEVGDLIAQFERSHNFQIIKYDLWDKDDERILPFFLKVLRDEAEEDLPRVAVLETLQLRDNKIPAGQREEIGRLLIRLMVDDSHYLVRNYATMAAAQGFMAVPEVFAAVAARLADLEEAEDIRHNALAGVQWTGPTKEARDVLQSLRQDAVMGEYISRILSEWKKKKKG